MSSDSTTKSETEKNQYCGKRFELKQWNAVALWKWNTDLEDCAICRNSLMDPCISCESERQQKGQLSTCNLVWGTCKHVFHEHCISKWIKTRNVCPLDNKLWNYGMYGEN